MLGHKGNEVINAYFKSDIGVLHEQYITCIPDLSIADVTVKTLKSEDYSILENRIKELEEYNQMLQDHNKIDKPI
jgi:hypothetical protein